MNIDKEFDAFMEFPTEDKTYVTSTSAKLFARVIAKAERERCDELVAALEKVYAADSLRDARNIAHEYLEALASVKGKA